LIKSKTKLHGSYPSSLLYTMATNVCLNKLRKRKRESPKELTEIDENFFTCTEQGIDQVDAEILLETVLKEESEMDRTICFMYHGDGLTLKEIGEAVGLSVAGVHKRLQAFKSRARLKLGNSGEDV